MGWSENGRAYVHAGPRLDVAHTWVGSCAAWGGAGKSGHPHVRQSPGLGARIRFDRSLQVNPLRKSAAPARDAFFTCFAAYARQVSQLGKATHAAQQGEPLQQVLMPPICMLESTTCAPIPAYAPSQPLRRWWTLGTGRAVPAGLVCGQGSVAVFLGKWGGQKGLKGPWRLAPPARARRYWQSSDSPLAPRCEDKPPPLL